MPAITILNPHDRQRFDSPPLFTKEERQRYFSIPSELKANIARITPVENRIGFLLQLGYFRSRARFFKVSQYRKRDINFVARLLKAGNPPSLSSYTGTIAARHRTKILTFLNWQAYDDTMSNTLLGLAENFSSQREHPKLIFDSLIDACWKHQVVIPSYSELNVIITEAFNKSERDTLTKI